MTGQSYRLSHCDLRVRWDEGGRNSSHYKLERRIRTCPVVRQQCNHHSCRAVSKGPLQQGVRGALFIITYSMGLSIVLQSASEHKDWP